MDLLIAVYFGRGYQTQDIRSILGALPGVGINSEVQAGLSATRPQEILYDSFTRKGLVEAQQIKGTVPGLLQTLGDDRVVCRLEGTLKGSGRRLSIHPFVHQDDTTTYDLEIGLLAGEERLSPSEVIRSVQIEDRLLRFFSQTDPLWSVIGVAAYPPSLGDLRDGAETLPSVTGYLGSEVVSFLGPAMLRNALKACPKVSETQAGGLFFDWAWKFGGPNQPPVLHEFAELIATKSIPLSIAFLSRRRTP